MMAGQVDDGEDGRRLAQLVKEGRKIDAIKLVREITGCGLKEGKEAVEKLEQELTQGKPAPLPSAAELEAEVRSLLRNGDKIQAIKAVRDATGCGLKEGKEAVERLEQGLSLYPSAPEQIGVETEAEVRRLSRSGDKIEAIKRYREATGCGLKEAKDAVDRIAAES